MKLDAYLDRIRFEGPVRPDLDTLRRVHRAHQFAVPFENLDVQLQRPSTLDPAHAFDKIVNRRRGGWCYEMNGLFGWALEQIGFEVRRLSAGVMREQLGDEPLGNHLCLLVMLDQPHLADVGFGGSMTGPIPLMDGAQDEEAPYRVKLARIADDYWRFTELSAGDPFSFDFRDGAADENLLAAKCRYLQADPASTFVQTLVVQRRDHDTHLSLRGRVLTTLHSTHKDKRVIQSPDEFVSTLRERFDLDVPEIADLWSAICSRHEAVFPGETPEPSDSR